MISQTPAGFDLRSLQIKGAAIAFYCDGQTRPCAVVHLDHTCTDYQRKGFFRIGLMPIAVFDGVTIEIQNTGNISNTLADLHLRFAGKGSEHVELHRVKLLWSSPSTNVLSVGTVRLGRLGVWELSEGVELTSRGTSIKAEHATFQAIGPQAGQLTMDTQPKWQCTLFSGSQQPIEKENKP